MLQTPSPHRFIIKKRPLEPQKSTPLREVSFSQQPLQPLSSQPQFKATPRFKFGSSQAHSTRRHEVTPSQSRWIDVPNHETVRENTVVDRDDAYSQLEQLDSAIDIVPSSSNPDNAIYQEHHEEDAFEAPLPKRRKLELDAVESFEKQANDYHDEDEYDDDTNITNDFDYTVHDEHVEYDAQPIVSSTEDFEDLLSTNLQRSTPARPRFIIPSTTQRPQPTPAVERQSTPAFILPHEHLTTPAPDEPQFAAHPRFKPLPEPVVEPKEPLPGAFSPRKKGQKFVIGGLADEVRGWLIDIETHGSVASIRAGGAHYALRLRVRNVEGGKGCFTTVVGEREGERGGEVKMILGEQGLGDDLQRIREPKMGDVIGVRPSIWETELEGEKFVVGAGWVVLG